MTVKPMTVCIIGPGLIGGSLGMALKRKLGRRGVTVIAAGRNASRVRKAVAMNAADIATTDLRKAVPAADVIVVCTPVETVPGVVGEAAKLAKPGAVITDAGSVKSYVVDGVRSQFRKLGVKARVTFVGSHPIAGSERAGIQNSRADLYQGATCVVCTDRGLADRRAVSVVKRLWSATGAKVYVLFAKEHDTMLAATSHFLHVVSFAVTRAVGSSRGGKPVARFAARAFRDMTRIAGSNLALWAGICVANKPAVLAELKRFSKELDGAFRAFGSAKQLEKYFTAAFRTKLCTLQGR